MVPAYLFHTMIPLISLGVAWLLLVIVTLRLTWITMCTPGVYAPKHVKLLAATALLALIGAMIYATSIL